MNYVLEPITASHGHAVMEIFNHYVRSGFAAYFDRPLPVEFFGRFLEAAQGYPAFVARNEAGPVVGFAMLRPFHPAPTMRRTAEVAYFIHPDHTRRGLGRLLLNQLITAAHPLGIDNLVASISSLNEESLAFHRKHAFVDCGRLPAVGHKHGRDFDVVWMQRKI